MSNVRRRLFQQNRQDAVSFSGLPIHGVGRDSSRRRRRGFFSKRSCLGRCSNRRFAIRFAAFFAAIVFLVWLQKWRSTLNHWRMMMEPTPFKLQTFHLLPVKDPPPFTVFYNIFIPNDKKGQMHTIRIVEEQMNQVKESTQSIVKSNGIIRVYYYSIGESFPSRLKEFHFQRDFCSAGVLCIHAGHARQGSEDFTLQAIHDFSSFQISQRFENGRHRVAYLHSKGSYHHSRPNEIWRNHLTDAALHHDCHSTENNEKCNVCGLQFYTEWGLFWPGNMWSARIDHIQRLIPPNQFESKVDEAIGDLLYLRWEGILESHLYTDRIDRFGLDRYHSENWIGSHYDLRPCDLSPTDKLETWLKMRGNSTTFEWAVGPRHYGGPADQLERAARENLWKSYDSRREMFFLAGWLFKFQLWYGRDGVPPSDSWFWRWFPDGSFWRNISKLGPTTAEVLRVALPRELGDSGRLHWERELGEETKQDWQGILVEFTHAVFLSIDARYGFSDKNLFERMPWQKEKGDVAVFYQVLGNELEGLSARKANEQALCSGSSTCTPLPILKNEYAGETLQHLRDFCIQHKNSIVSYYQANTGRSKEEVDFAHWAEEISVGKRDVVTVLDYSSSGFLSRGNIWTANCSYISKLPNLSLYLKGVVQSSKKKLALTMKRRILMELYNASDYLLTERQSLAHWVVSHPAVNVQPAKFSSVEISAHWGDPNHELWKSFVGNEIAETRNVRIRECAFLSCNLVTWETIYQEYPDTKSWVWDWFPDGQEWHSRLSKSVSTSEGDVVEFMTREFAETKV